jgi:hypothetical protein
MCRIDHSAFLMLNKTLTRRRDAIWFSGKAKGSRTHVYMKFLLFSVVEQDPNISLPISESPCISRRALDDVEPAYLLLSLSRILSVVFWVLMSCGL